MPAAWRNSRAQPLVRSERELLETILQRVEGPWQAHRESRGSTTDALSAELVHLRNLRDRPTKTYTRGPTLQKELRHLRDLGFIKYKKPIADLPASFQSNQYLDLTEKGKDRARSITRADQKR